MTLSEDVVIDMLYYNKYSVLSIIVMLHHLSAFMMISLFNNHVLW
jgi:hypothetical protein